MLITGVVVVLFILGLFFEMLGSQPRRDEEGQIDTERDPVSPSQVESTVPVPHA